MCNTIIINANAHGWILVFLANLKEHFDSITRCSNLIRYVSYLPDIQPVVDIDLFWHFQLKILLL